VNKNVDVIATSTIHQVSNFNHYYINIVYWFR